MPVIYQKRIYREDLKKNPLQYYLFGDNEARIGLGGQAREMRGEPNAIGVATLAAPGLFWSDQQVLHNIFIIGQDLLPAIEAAKRGETIVIPEDGLGTGLAQLSERAPRTFLFLQTMLAGLEALS